MHVALSQRTAPAARVEMRRLLSGGWIKWATHAEERLKEHRLTIPDVINVVRAGVVDEGELENGSWRYRVRTQRIAVVAAFDGDDDEDKADTLVIVTAWRIER